MGDVPTSDQNPHPNPPHPTLRVGGGGRAAPERRLARQHPSTYVSTLSIREPHVKSSVKKWGNSPSVRIPAAVMAASGLRLDQAVDVRAEDGRVVIEPIPDPAADAAFTAALAGTLDEWASPADEAAWAKL